MSVYLTSRMLDPTSPGGEAAGLAPALRRSVRAASQRWQRHKMARALERLDERTLADIGICREDIPRVVEAFDPRELRMIPVAQSASARRGEPRAAGGAA